MPLHTPMFWTLRGWKAILLLPFALLYAALTSLRIKPTPYHASKPVICIGNIVVGGAGKTPTCIALAHLLQSHGTRVAFVSRGYGGKHKHAIAVNPNTHRSCDVGDEPLLLARHAPTFIAKNRVDAIKLAEHSAVDIIIMDDGLQNNAVHKDISLLVMHGEYGLGNRWFFPAGPLRESLRNARKRLNAAIIIGDDRFSLASELKNIPTFKASLHADVSALSPKKLYLAFAGIAHPSRFFDTAKEHGLTLVHTASFADHHEFTPEECNALQSKAKKMKAILLTTEKDAVRLPQELRKNINTLPVNLKIKHSNRLVNLLTSTSKGNQ